MNIHSTKNFLGNTSNRLEATNFKVSLVNYTQKVSEEWHYHENIHLSSIIQGGNLESRKKEDIQVLPGKVMLYDQGEIHRNRYTAHPSKNLNIEFKKTSSQRKSVSPPSTLTPILISLSSISMQSFS